jgi:hypothetical protein
MINRRQILNITGFRKALKKFEKATGVRQSNSVQLWISEVTALGSGAGFVHEGKGQFSAARCVVID